MLAPMGWVGRHPGLLILLGAVILGQVLQKVAQPLLTQAVPSDEVPVVPIVVLALALVLAILVVWFRARLGSQLDAAAAVRAPSVVMPESLPSRYAVADPAGRVVAGVLGLIDLALLLLLQNTLRGPVLALNEHYAVVSRTLADAVWVGVVVVLALVLLMKVWRASGPVLVLLMWWGLDRVVPTVGFVGARPTLPQPVAAMPVPSGTPPLLAPQTSVHTAAEQEATVLAQATVHTANQREATVIAPQVARAGLEDEATLLAPQTPHTSKDGEATLVAEQTLPSIRDDAGGTP